MLFLHLYLAHVNSSTIYECLMTLVHSLQRVLVIPGTVFPNVLCTATNVMIIKTLSDHAISLFSYFC